MDGRRDAPLKGFKWELGVDRVTSGIQMWPEVFCTTLPNGEKVAIILLDTQGLFDHKTKTEMNAKIYALSTLISSVQIYNLSKNIQDTDLQLLKFFTDYGALSRDVPGGQEKASFQKLLFLIRDWFYPHQFSYGSDGGQKYINKILNPSDDQPEELKAIRKQIESAFSEVEGFLMPFPGNEVASNPDFNGQLSDIDLRFKNSLQELIPLLLTPTNLILKEINGRRVKVKELVEYLEKYVEKLNNKEHLVPKSIWEANAELSHQHALEAAGKMFEDRMEIICGNSLPPREEPLIKNTYENSYQDALSFFENRPKFGDDSYTSLYRKKLTENMEQLYKFYRQDNDKKKQIQKLESQVQELLQKSAYEKTVNKLLNEIENLKAERERSWLSKLSNWFVDPVRRFLSNFI